MDRTRRRITLMRALAPLLILISGSVFAEERAPLLDTNPPYVQIIVTACPPAETPLEPINQGKSYDNERSMTRAERTAYFRASGCIEVPIPAERIARDELQAMHGTRRLYGVPAIS